MCALIFSDVDANKSKRTGRFSLMLDSDSVSED